MTETDIEYISMAAACKRFSIGRTRLSRWCNQPNTFTSVRMGNKRLIELRSLRAFVESHRTEKKGTKEND